MVHYLLSISWQQTLPTTIPTLWVVVGGCMMSAFAALIFVFLIWAEIRWQLLAQLRQNLPEYRSDAVVRESGEQGDPRNTGETTAVSDSENLGQPVPDTRRPGLSVGRVTAPVDGSGYEQKLVPGQQLGRYQVDGVIGEGPLGTIYQGYQLDLGRKVVIKFFAGSVTNRSGFRERFLDAMHAVAGLDHPSIASVDHYETSPACTYLARAFVPGPTLDVYIDHLQAVDEEVGLSQKLELVAQVADGLGHAHGQGVVHGRIRLDNVLLQPLETRNGAGAPQLRAVITDFAMSHLYAEELALAQTADPDLYPYLSPEQCRERPLDSRSDIYTLGVLLYRITTGQFPFTADSLEEARRLHQDTAPPAPRQVHPLLPESVERIILQALAKEPAQRFRNGDEMARALRSAAAAVGNGDGDSVIAATAGDRSISGGTEGPRQQTTPRRHELGLILIPAKVAVTPGQRVDLQILVENRGTRVDRIRLSLDGIPLDWATISENDVQLLPGARGCVLLTVRLPQTSGAAATDHPISLHAQSEANPDVTAEAHGTLAIRPFHKLTVEMQPERLRNKGTCKLLLRNDGNVAVAGTVTTRDPAKVLHPTPLREQVMLAPGEELVLPLRVAPPQRPLLGSREFVPFEVAVQTPANDAPILRSGHLEILPLIPAWAPAFFTILLLVCVSVVFLSSLWVNRDDVQATATAETIAAGTATAEAAVPISPTVPLPTSTATPVPNPASCTAIRQHDAEAGDGDYTIYLNGNAAFPFNVYCHNMDGSPAEYLTLANNGGPFNYSLISHPEGALVTHYRRLRIDPASLVVDIQDRTFTTFGDDVPGYSAIPLDVAASYALTFSDYGRAEGCNQGDASVLPGEANVDLNGTAFALAETVTFTVDGNAIQLPIIDVSPERKVVNLSVGGRCAHIRAVLPLQLAYVPVADGP